MATEITLCVPTLSRYDLLARAVSSARAGALPPSRVLVIDNGGGLAEYMRTRPDVWPAELAAAVEVHTFPQPGAPPGKPSVRNLGVAASWNWFMRNVPQDYVVISNDDVGFRPRTIEALVATAEKMPGQVFFCASVGQAFSLYLLRKRALDLVGPFDENFWPAYFEDGDYARRLALLGQRENFSGEGYEHEGSATVRVADPDMRRRHHGWFDANSKYYVRKWGGPPHHEKYTVPFNGE